MTHFHIWWLITKPPVFHHKKTTLSSSPYQKIYHKIVLFNGFVLFLCWPNFLNIKKMVHRLNHLGVGCLGFKWDPKVWFPALKELLENSRIENDRDQNFHGKQKMMKVEVVGLANKKKHKLPNHLDFWLKTPLKISLSIPWNTAWGIWKKWTNQIGKGTEAGLLGGSLAGVSLKKLSSVQFFFYNGVLSC